MTIAVYWDVKQQQNKRLHILGDCAKSNMCQVNFRWDGVRVKAIVHVKIGQLDSIIFLNGIYVK